MFYFAWLDKNYNINKDNLIYFVWEIFYEARIFNY